MPRTDTAQATRTLGARPGGRLAVLMAALAVALAPAACGGDDEQEVAPAPGCEQVAAPAPKDVDLKPPKRRLESGSKVTATVRTSCGAFQIALDTERSPRTSSSFVHMAQEGVYDDTAFHRIVPGFVIQGGDPLGDGTGGPGYSVDEPPPPDTVYERGMVAMAKSAAEPPGRSGSQFFVVTAPGAADLPPDYALLGEVVAGQDTVERIESLGDPASGDAGTPTAPVVIESVAIHMPAP